MLRSNAGEPVGILNRRKAERKFNLSRFLPAAELRFWVENYWIVDWDLRDQSAYVAETLPHPSVCLTFESGKATIVGVVSGKFRRRLEGSGRVFGIKFWPGASKPFVKSPVALYTDRVVPAETVLSRSVKSLARDLAETSDKLRMLELVDDFLRENLPDPDATVALVVRIVNRIRSDREILKVQDLLIGANLSKRSLQRLFQEYVGVSPKWVIQRYRLHEAAERLAQGDIRNWPRLALELGYYDQAHFIKDFKSLVGQSPKAYCGNLGWRTQPHVRLSE